MFLLPSFTLPPEMRESMRRSVADVKKRRLAACVPWDPAMKWQPELNLLASTYQTRNIFTECTPIDTDDVNHIDSPGIISPDGRWLYAVKLLPAGTQLNTWQGSRTGSVIFDGPIEIPSLHERELTSEKWKSAPWMSHTPAEVMSLRAGTRLAKGHTIVAGLGLGHQLVEVSKRKQVTKLTLVEKSQSLVDWVLPQLKPFLAQEVDVVVGNAYEVMKTMEADVALVDIFPYYGNNGYKQTKLIESCFGIDKVWCWGTARVGERY